MRRAGRLLIIGCIVVVAIGVPACGSSDDGDRDSSRNKSPQGQDRSSQDTKTNPLGRRELPEVRRMLERLVSGVNRRDPAVCTQVYTQRYRELIMEKKGGAATSQCRRQVRSANFKSSLVRIEKVEIYRSSRGILAGDVQAIQRINDDLLRVDFDVVRSGGGYRIDRGSGAQLTVPPG